MGFDSFEFWLLFLGILGAYHILSSLALRNGFLLICSYLFYASWSWHFLPIILISTVTDYFCGFMVEAGNSTKKRNWGLGISLFINLGMLFLFKYTHDLFPSTDFLKNFSRWGIPLGISFYTFQTLSYTFDVYKGKIKHTKNIVNFALYVSFFPQLIMGPIEKARRLLPQLESQRKVSFRQLHEGVYLITLGLFKKIFVANSLSVPVDAIFSGSTPSSGLALVASLLMVCQVYCDFSGYSDMARGMARLFGIKLMVNFKPFFTSYRPSQFWQNWHISLTEWIRDYMVLPFRDKKKREGHLYIQLLLIMAMVGLWHRATWNWLCFGLMHGAAIVVDRFLAKQRWKLPAWCFRSFGYLSMLTIYVLSGALHRSQDWTQFTKMISSILQCQPWGHETTALLIYASQFLLPLFMFETIQLKTKNEFYILDRSPWIQGIFWGVALSAILILSRWAPQGFLYYSF
ncbi:MAG: MBOAT family protein [Bdellovibrionales bacterium]|nr:MBOAT family protein [Bdellovibrionales bacterium]